jgi:iron complex transport system substrate-binding protein
LPLKRSLKEILSNILLLGRLIGEESKATKLIKSFEIKLQKIQTEASRLPIRPKVYFEEWDGPHYSCIQWVSELIYAAGGQNIFIERSGAMARDREVSLPDIVKKNPDIIFGCWCGKKVKVDSFAKRPGHEAVSAVQNGFIWELDPAIFLQPGPALFVDGLDQMFEKIQKVAMLLS